MSGPLTLGLRYLAWHRGKTLILLAAVTLMMFLPAATRNPQPTPGNPQLAPRNPQPESRVLRQSAGS